MEKELERRLQSVTHTPVMRAVSGRRSHRRQVEKELERRLQSVTHTPVMRAVSRTVTGGRWRRNLKEAAVRHTHLS